MTQGLRDPFSYPCAGSAPAVVDQAADDSSGLKQRLLRRLEQRLERLPDPAELFKTSAEITLRAFEVLLGIWLLVGVFAGVVEIIPVIGPLTAGALAVGVGMTELWQLALVAGLVVLGVRLLEDYVVIPKVLRDRAGRRSCRGGRADRALPGEGV